MAMNPHFHLVAEIRKEVEGVCEDAGCNPDRLALTIAVAVLRAGFGPVAGRFRGLEHMCVCGAQDKNGK